MRQLCLLLLLVCASFALSAQDSLTYDFVVDASGGGDFSSVQDAIDAVPALRKERTVIYIRKGTYMEKLLLPPTATNVTFIGEEVTETILTYDDYAQRENRFGEEIGTSGSSSFFVFGDGFTARNITFANTAGPVGQAVAVRVDGDQVIFENCRFLGNQDTLYPHGRGSRQYYRDCYIEGTVDFIFGWATAVFDNCEIYCKSPGYITAASTEEVDSVGFVFRDCTITGDAPAGSVYLGRPWRPYAQTVFLDCKLGEVVHPAGWHNWGSEEKEGTAYYAEHGSTGPGAAAEERVSWSHELSDDEAQRYRSLETLFGGWVPTE